jgi:chromosome segregation ATPase
MSNEATGSNDKGGLSNDELEAKINDVDARLSKAIAELRTDVTGSQTELSTSLTNAVNEMKKINATAKGNETRLGAVESGVSTLTHNFGKVESSVKAVTSQIDSLQQVQGELNTAFVKGLQEGKDFALEQGKDAKGHADKVVGALDSKVESVKGALDARITAVENAPVKPHTHKVHVSVDATTGAPEAGK